MSLLSSSVLAVLLATSVSPAWQLEVDPWVFEQTREGAQTEFLVVLDKQADLSAAESLPRLERRRFVFETLRATAAASQGPVLAMLADRGLEHRSYWISNMIWVRGSLADVEALAQREDVAKISANPWVKADLPDAPDPQLGACPPPATEASLLHIDADVFWDAGFEGEGVVIGGQDTGYDWDHPALRDSYRGWNGAAADHNYHWWDAIHSGGGSCGADSTEPCDDGSHGTHTMGTMVGDDGTRRVGMAPKAKWIGCRNMNQGFGTPTTYAECFQFFIAPTDLSGQNPDPSMGPDVINNSWGCPGFEGCTDPNVLRTVVENTRAAGIVVVVSAGNGGSGCGSVNTPAAIYDASFSVGNTNLS
ncbi:MAG: S8 family serine peptidase, partial [Acidobacteriota bacterium]